MQINLIPHSQSLSTSSLPNGKEGVQHPIHLLAKGSVISPKLTNLLVHVSLKLINFLIHVSLDLINALVESGLTGLDLFFESGLIGLDLFFESGLTGLRLQPVHGQEGGYGSPCTGLGPFRKG